MSIESELKQIKGSKEFYVVEDVEAWAKSHPKSALHKSLEWDDGKAGYQYRLWQCRRLITLHITYEDGTRSCVSLTTDRSHNGGGYRDIDDVLRDKSLTEIMLADALSELQRIEAKYDRLKQLKPVWRAAARIRTKQAEHSGASRSTDRTSIAKQA
jgi:hypothetical protein